jgi:NAD+ synthase
VKPAIAKIDLSIDPFGAVGLLVHFLADQFNKKGYTDAVLGLSGGVDSALGAALLAEALGPKHVTGLAMPSGQSNPASLRDARAVARTLSIRLEVQPIGSAIRALLPKSGTVSRMRIGNMAARLRMIRLFDYSHAHNALVAGTSNKTELLLGYGTWYGDLACSINPLGDLYKSQVWQLADFMGIPEQVVTKAPSADLWKGQTDESELGFTYAEVDRLLYLMVDCSYSDDALNDAGFARTFIRTVRTRIAASQFKRSLPTIPKLSAKTIGTDFHFSRDWGT